MMSLNLKLQSTASKNQARHIDLEVKKIEAREARELLNIVQVGLCRRVCCGTLLKGFARSSPICLKSMLSPTWMRQIVTCSSSA